MRNDILLEIGKVSILSHKPLVQTVCFDREHMFHPIDIHMFCKEKKNHDLNNFKKIK